MRRLVLSLALAACALAPAAARAATAPPSTLVGRAVLPAATFAPGPESGTLLGTDPINGVQPPFPGQPVQGFSGALRAGHGLYWVLADNGYGTLETSADFDLRVYLIDPHLRRAGGGSGRVDVERFIELHDPDHEVPFAIVHQWTHDRVLTGADFDPESMQRAPDGTLWFGDEFGPFLLHTDARGKVLHAPYALPDPDHPGHQIRSPQSPRSEEGSVVRVMNALRGDAQAHNDPHTPVVSPDAALIADHDPSTGVATRHPPAGSGLKPASSEIFDVDSLHAAGFKVVPYTVDAPKQMRALLKLGVDGLISDRPDLLHRVVANFDADGDGTPGDLLNPDGTVNAARFDAEAHRGGRDLRPENTLPSMEVGLDTLATTLETDNAVTKDGVPVLSHDPYVDTGKCRRTDGRPYTAADEVLIHDLTLHQLQTRFICDGIIRTGTPQTNERSRSPVAVAFARQEGLPDPYVIPTARQLYAFARFYAAWYRTGPGAGSPKAAVRAANAARVRFNVETKINPRSDRDQHGNVYRSRTVGPTAMTRAVAGAIEDGGVDGRADVQSFDFRTLRLVHRRYSELPTVALWGDTPVVPGPAVSGIDGTNLQPEGREHTTRWLAGLYWPYRQTVRDTPFRAQRSGGFEGMAITPDGHTLMPVLEKPETGESGSVRAFAFDLRTKRYEHRTWRLPLAPKGVSVPDFQLTGPHRGLVIERDDSQGTTNGYKALVAVQLPGDGGRIATAPAADLLHIADPHGVSGHGAPGDVGLGDPYAMPFQTIEGLTVDSGRRVTVFNDDNFPFSVGRHAGSGRPDDDEVAVLRLARQP